MNRPRLTIHVIHKQIVTKRIGSREIRFAGTHFGYLLHKLNKSVIASKHEGID